MICFKQSVKVFSAKFSLPTAPRKFSATQLKKVCSLTHSVLFLKCDLIQNKLKVKQIVHSWELYTVYTTFQCVYASCFVYCVHSQSPHSEQHVAVFLLSLHFKDNF